MTEADWQVCDDPLKMLIAVQRSATSRKLRLFACACWRTIWTQLPFDSNRALVAAIEEYPDATSEHPPLSEALTASTRSEWDAGGDAGYWAVKALGRSFYKFTPINAAVQVVARLQRHPCADLRALAACARCIFRNPASPSPAIEPAWLTWKNGTIASLARSINDAREFQALPVLADALADAGCTNVGILDHCRTTGTHGRGCHVVDLLLGKK